VKTVAAVVTVICAAVGAVTVKDFSTRLTTHNFWHMSINNMIKSKQARFTTQARCCLILNTPETFSTNNLLIAYSM